MYKIVEEVPGITDYRWFISSDDPNFDHRIGPEFMTLDEARQWCQEMNVEYIIELNQE